MTQKSRRPLRSRRGSIRVWAGTGAALAAVSVLALVAALSPGRSGLTAATGAAASTAPAAGRGSAPAPGSSPASPSSPIPAPSSPAPGSGANPTLAGLETRVPGDPLALGRVNAPVIMVEWADFQCPFCGRFARDTQPVLVHKYVDTGKLRIEWRDFPYLGPQSTTAAEAARAAAGQGKFWQYHNALYASQHAVNSGALTDTYLVGLARRLGLNTARFRADMTSPATAQAVKADLQQGTALGINGTPAFVIASTPVFGAQPTATFEKVINAALARAG